MRILITGGRGMLGRTLAKTFADDVVQGPDYEDLDITNVDSVENYFATFQPELVLHCAAATQVDKCESEVEQAFLINETGSANVAQACAQYNARLIAYSTDYVFSGDADRPYSEDDEPDGGINVYGRSKWAGEQAIAQYCPDAVIARISWLYGPGGPSFVHTMLALAKKGLPELKVVNDQLGNPTSTLAVAKATKELALRPELTGIFHLTCSGEATWYDFSKEIFRLAGIKQRVIPCTTDEFPRPAARPSNSRLAKTRQAKCHLSPMPSWQQALAEFLALELPTLQG